MLCEKIRTGFIWIIYKNIYIYIYIKECVRFLAYISTVLSVHCTVVIGVRSVDCCHKAMHKCWLKK